MANTVTVTIHESRETKIAGTFYNEVSFTEMITVNETVGEVGFPCRGALFTTQSFEVTTTMDVPLRLIKVW